MNNFSSRFLTRKYQAIAAASLFLFFLFLRVSHLGAADFWYDEFCTLLSGLVHLPINEPPLYYFLIRFWVKFFGMSEAAVRSLSTVFSAASIILTYQLGKELFGKKAGFLAALIMGLSPFQLWYAQEARHYSFLLFLSLGSSLALLKALRSSRISWWIVFIAASSAGLYTHHFYPVLLFAQLLYLLLERSPGRFVRFLLLAGILAVLFTPHLRQYLEAFCWRKSGFWINVPDLESLRFTFENLFLGYHGSSRLYQASLLLCASLCAVSLRLLKDRADRKSYFFCLLLFLFPLMGAFIFSHCLFSVYLDRAFITISPFYYLILSAAIVTLEKRTALLVVIVLTAMLFAADLRYYRGEMVEELKHHNGLYIKKPLKPLARFLTDAVDGKHDTVVFTNYSAIALWAYWREPLAQRYFLFAPGVRDENIKKPFRLEDWQIPCARLLGFDIEKLWLVACDWGRTGALDANSREVKNWLDHNFNLTFSRNFDGTWVFGYSRRLQRKK